MGHALAFDTHAYVKKLVTAGVSEAQAEVQAEALSGLLENNLATKRDIAEIKRDMAEMETSLRRDMGEMETSLKRDMKALETSTRRDLKELEMRLTIRLGAIMAGGIAIVAALVKLL